MQENRLDYLLDRYLARETTPDELIEFDELLKAEEKSTFTRTIAEKMQYAPPADIDDIEKWDRMLQHILAVDKPAVSKKTVPLYRWMAAAAAAIILAVTGTWLWTNQHHTTTGIADNIISTAYEPRTITLSDGTQIWLNAGSSIRYANTFNEQNRTVYLSGEAFFDVKHADKLPFRIQSGMLTTTVLGTSFNITAYPKEQTIISVQTGKIKVETASKTLAVLEKGTQLRVATDTNTQQNNIDPQQIAAWRTGNLIYKNETLEDIAADLQRNFKDSIRIKKPELKTILINISITKDIGLKNALELITRTTDSKLTYQNGIYIIE